MKTLLFVIPIVLGISTQANADSMVVSYDNGSQILYVGELDNYEISGEDHCRYLAAEFLILAGSNASRIDKITCMDSNRIEIGSIDKAGLENGLRILNQLIPKNHAGMTLR